MPANPLEPRPSIPRQIPAAMVYPTRATGNASRPLSRRPAIDGSGFTRSGPVPQERRHHGLADQVDALVRASETDPEPAFMARLMTLCSLPRSNPGNRTQYVRRNGPYTLTMFASEKTKLPYGNLPRLLMAWISTEAVRTQSRELVLGESVSEFMRRLNIYSSSGEKHARLREQMWRLFNVHIQLIYEDAHGRESINSLVADRTQLWWNLKRPDDRTLWKSTIELGEKFFEEIIRHPVPLDLNALKALKRSPLGLDLYMWLTYRTFKLDAPLRLSWPTLYRQFGVEPKRASDKRTVDYFRADCLRELTKIQAAWPGLEYQIERGRRHERTGAMILLPSTPRIPPLKLVP